MPCLTHNEEICVELVVIFVLAELLAVSFCRFLDSQNDIKYCTFYTAWYTADPIVTKTNEEAMESLGKFEKLFVCFF